MRAYFLLYAPYGPDMATPENTPRRWADFLNPDDETLDRLRHAGRGATSLAAVGTPWDTVGGRWEALAIASLERGLAALDVLDLPLDAGHPVFADHARSELIVLVPEGTAARAVDGGPQAVRALTAGTWLVVPHGPTGGYVAAWLSRPTRGGGRYVDPVRLCEAVLVAEALREEHARAC
ncbi:hypothetical protein M877_39885 (plasmid) [Streptomyces niveus NCIMB 11891]|nr:hypothetical protein M877_39885 [Streptomyces niveus NCIMB 11891]